MFHKPIVKMFEMIMIKVIYLVKQYNFLKFNNNVNS